MGKKKKADRLFVILKSTEGKWQYTTTKNRKNTPNALTLKKYDPYLKRHTIHKEIK